LIGAIVGMVVVSFILLTEHTGARLYPAGGSPWRRLLMPIGGSLGMGYLLYKYFPEARGSGVPQTKAALFARDGYISLGTILGKFFCTSATLACGIPLGREGPTVQVGAAIMHTLGRLVRLPRLELQRALVLAGGAAGVAAAFNTPLAGVVFAIEELSHSFETRTSGTVLTAVIIAGITTLALVGNYTYFGHTSAELDFGRGWIAVVLCSLAGGLFGGLFSAALIRAAGGLPGRVGQVLMRHPVAFAALCGLALAVIGVASGGQTYGTGYDQARGMVEGTQYLPGSYVVLKFAATVISYISGIPGGLFAPSLSVGAGLGAWLAQLMPAAPAGAVVLLGMVAYFSGVVQAPITATIIVMEMTDNQRVTIPLLATAFLAFGASRLVCRQPIYSALARRFLEVQEGRTPAQA
ncbi:MAG: chloride channel protein, partial [Acetobacteraceae bacterium]|nr:chloride channel protein [Acetobacteraceae bacterium]